MKRLLVFFMAAFFTLLAFPATTSAMVSMYSAKYVDGPNLILITNNAHTVQSDIPTTYNVRLYTMTGGSVPYSNVHVEITQQGDTLYKQMLRRSKKGDTNLVFTFPKQGTYELSVHFIDNDKSVAKGEFPLVVSKGPSQGLWTDVLSVQAVLAFALGIAASQAYQRRAALRSIISTKKSHINKKKHAKK